MNVTTPNQSVANASYGTVTEPGTLRFERVLPGPIERVWAYLTESEKRSQWLASGEMALRVGGEVELTWHNGDLSPNPEPTPERYQQYEGYTMHGRITACEPPRLLAYTWGESTDGGSEVTFELSAHGDDVHLVLTHRGLFDRTEQTSVASGWHTHVGILVDLLEGRTPAGFWATHAQVEVEYLRRLPAG